MAAWTVHGGGALTLVPPAGTANLAGNVQAGGALTLTILTTAELTGSVTGSVLLLWTPPASTSHLVGSVDLVVTPTYVPEAAPASINGFIDLGPAILWSPTALGGAWYIDIENTAPPTSDVFPTVSVQISQTGPLEVPDWITLTATPYAWTSYRGRSGELDDISPGTGSISLDNRDGPFDPDNAASPYAGLLTTNRRIRIVVTWEDIDYVVFDQWVNYWPEDDDPTFPSRAVTVPTTGALGRTANLTISPAVPFTLDDPDLGVLDGPALLTGPPVFPAQLSGNRIAEILEVIGWPDDLADIDTGLSLLVADAPTDNALPVMQQIARSEMGLLFDTVDGRIVFRQRNAPIDNPPYVFTDNPPLQPGEPYEEVTIDTGSSAVIKNRVTRTAGDLTFSTNDLDSQAALGIIEDSKTDLLNATFADLVGQCEYVITRYADGVVRITGIRINSVADPAGLFPFLLAVDLGWKVTVGRTPKLGGPIVLRDCIVESVTTTVTAPAQWVADLTLVESDPNQYFTLDVDVLDGPAVLAF